MFLHLAPVIFNRHVRHIGPETIEAAAAEYGLEKLSNTATDFFITMGFIDAMDDEKFAIFMELADEMVKYESCAGMSNHALLICSKPAE